MGCALCRFDVRRNAFIVFRRYGALSADCRRCLATLEEHVLSGMGDRAREPSVGSGASTSIRRARKRHSRSAAEEEFGRSCNPMSLLWRPSLVSKVPHPGSRVRQRLWRWTDREPSRGWAFATEGARSAAPGQISSLPVTRPISLHIRNHSGRAFFEYRGEHSNNATPRIREFS